MPLLAWCLAAFFLIAQTQASTHHHDEDGHDDVTTECSTCILGSQLNYSIAHDDIALSAMVLVWSPLALVPESQFKQVFPADIKARGPPRSYPPQS